MVSIPSYVCSSKSWKLGFALVIVMRKGRNVVVLSSSDDEDDKLSLSSNRSYKKPKARSVITRTNPRPEKKPRVSRSWSRLSKISNGVDEVSFNFLIV